ncbi:MAG: ABC transporter substrate-binding protein, partial [Alphaproteobacteria bacterium]|nr:ABC transporter substrate-binding protein [Alphaproteobacteria bacterium]
AGNLTLPALTDFQDQVNDAGGIGGISVRAVAEDSGNIPQNALANYRRAITDENLVFYYGDSTGFMKLVAPELNETKRVLVGSTSFASELANPATNPFQFVSGPTYQDQFDVLLQFIKSEGGGRLALIFADSEFGRDPIEHGKARAAELGIEVVLEEVTKISGADIETHVTRLAQTRPDFAILHGYVTSVWPQIIGGARQVGLQTQFLGTFWGMEKVIADRVTAQAGPFLDGYMGVMPYRYFYEAADAPAYQRLAALKKAQDPDFPNYLTTWYLQVTMTLELWKKSMETVIEQDQEVNAETLAAALGSISGWDTGGFFGAPVTVTGHKIPQGRVYRYSADSGLFVPISDWIQV